MLPVDIITDEQVMQFVASYMWPLFRIAAMLMAYAINWRSYRVGSSSYCLGFYHHRDRCSIITRPLPVMDFAVDRVSYRHLSSSNNRCGYGIIAADFFSNIYPGGSGDRGVNSGLGFASMNDPSSGCECAVNFTVLFNNGDPAILCC